MANVEGQAKKAVDQPPVDDRAYPNKLKTAEEELIKQRPGRDPFKRDALVGVGLSGGGIRSATFCLGVFQAFARLGLLGKIDYTSSVSGGGYFASFYGRLFTRDEVKDLVQVAGILAPDETSPANAGTPDWMRQTFRWLRENGRYLSPHGAGDLLLDLSVVLRNWLSMQIIMAIFILTSFLAMQLIRASVQSSPGIVNSYLKNFFYLDPAMRGPLWWSPYLLPGLVLLVFFAFPAGWAYWLLGGQRAPSRTLLSMIGLKGLERFFFFGFGPWLVPIAVIAFAKWTPSPSASGYGLVSALGSVRLLALQYVQVAAVVSAITLGFATVVVVIAWFESSPKVGDNIDPSDIAGNLLSNLLKVALVVSLGIIGLGLIDTFGQTAYAQGLANSWKWLVPLVGPIALAMPLAPFVQSMVANLGKGTKGKPVSVPIAIVAGIVAAALILPMLILLDYCSHVLAYSGPDPAAGMHWTTILGALIVAVVFSLLLGRSQRFLNSSSLNGLYTARLVRAYLGASNPERLRGGESVSDVLSGDDIAQEEYWKRTSAKGGGISNSFERGAPIHLVNVTINETSGGDSEVEQHDRKGIGMAIGPAAISAGVKDHVVFPPASTEAPGLRRWRHPILWLRTKDRPPWYRGVSIFPNDTPTATPAFRYTDGVYDGQRLALGSWTGISGAAVATGLGSRTSLALSLLTGFFNVRLGYWWDARVSQRHSRRTAGGFFGFLFNLVFPVQHALLNEFLSRFPGTSERYWYLSDGGHFENMGGYELIRRRLPLIVIIDAEEDGDYTYQGLAGLVQKARLDFGAEIEFLDTEKLNERFARSTVHEMRPFFGTLDQLRRGAWVREPVIDPATKRERLALAPSSPERFSLAHAAVAKITYAKDQNGNVGTGEMIVIKPTLTGDEPVDVLHYHGEHPAFPHESTADQWFDEAQWESYRKLGEHIGTKLFELNEANGPFPAFSRT